VTRRAAVAGLAAAALSLTAGADPAQARVHHLTISDVVHIAHGNPFACDLPPKGRLGWKQLHCITRVVFRREPSLGREADLIIGCESGWDRWEVTPPYSASGLAQFLPSTWARLPRRISHHSVYHAVWNVIGMRYLRLQDGSWVEWSCASIVGVR
jgi:hypothetical protein